MDKIEGKLNAKEARKITENTTKPFSHIYDAIKHAAENGYAKLEFCINGLPASTVSRIIDELTKSKYTLDPVNHTSETITIRW